MSHEHSYPLIKIAEGEYLVTYVAHEKRGYFGSDKMHYYFRIVDGPDRNAIGKIIKKFYNCSVDKDGRISAGFLTDYFRDVCLVAGESVQLRNDRIPVTIFKDKILKVEVCTVDKGRKSRLLPPQAQYSKIASILQVMDSSVREEADIPF